MIAIQKYNWVKKAFRLKAKLFKSEYTVIIKGLSMNLLYSIVDALILKEIQATILETIYYRIEHYCNPNTRYTIYIIYICTTEAAERLCNKDLV